MTRGSTHKVTSKSSEPQMARLPHTALHTLGVSMLFAVWKVVKLAAAVLPVIRPSNSV